jgi:hypothetical protein
MQACPQLMKVSGLHFRSSQLPEHIHVVHDKASLTKAPYSHALRLKSLRSRRNEWGRLEPALCTKMAGEVPDLFALLIDSRCIMFCLQNPTEVPGICLNEYCVAC